MRCKWHVLAAIIVVCLPPGLASAQGFNCSQATESPHAIVLRPDYDHARYAPFPQRLSKGFAAYYAVFDDADDDDGDGEPDLRANPDFVAYELKGLGLAADGNYREPPVSINRPSKWYRSPELSFLWSDRDGITATRVDDSYRGIGDIWNRGHLAMSDHAQRIGAEASCNTHHFWNASPQAKDLNQGPWRHLEDYAAAASNKFRGLWVVTGPIFDPSTAKLAIGDPGEIPVEVPDAFFKVLVHENPLGIATLAFIYEQPNAADANGVPVPTASWVNCNRAKSLNHVYDHRPMLTAIASIEARTSLQFFTGRADGDALVEARAEILWPVEERYWDPKSTCAGQRGHP